MKIHRGHNGTADTTGRTRRSVVSACGHNGTADTTGRNTRSRNGEYSTQERGLHGDHDVTNPLHTKATCHKRLHTDEDKGYMILDFLRLNVYTDVLCKETLNQNFPNNDIILFIVRSLFVSLSFFPSFFIC